MFVDVPLRFVFSMVLALVAAIVSGLGLGWALEAAGKWLVALFIKWGRLLFFATIILLLWATFGIWLVQEVELADNLLNMTKVGASRVAYFLFEATWHHGCAKFKSIPRSWCPEAVNVTLS